MSLLEMVFTITGIILTLANAWLMWVVNTFQADIKSLRLVDELINRRMAEIQLLVAGSYVTREEFKDAVKEVKGEFKSLMQDQTTILIQRMGTIDQRIGANMQRIEEIDRRLHT